MGGDSQQTQSNRVLSPAWRLILEIPDGVFLVLLISNEG